MKFLVVLCLALALCIGVIVGISYYADLGSSDRLLSSPLPTTLSKLFYPAQHTSNYWMPNLKAHASGGEVDVSAKSAISYDLTSNSLIYSKNIDEKLPIASLTKLMTAIVALENEHEGDRITISHTAATIGEDS